MTLGTERLSAENDPTNSRSFLSGERRAANRFGERIGPQEGMA